MITNIELQVNCINIAPVVFVYDRVLGKQIVCVVTAEKPIVRLTFRFLCKKKLMIARNVIVKKIVSLLKQSGGNAINAHAITGRSGVFQEISRLLQVESERC